MSVKFTKLHEVDLSLADQENGQQLSDGSISPFSADSDTQDEGIVQFELENEPKFVPTWKFWHRNYRYNLTTKRSRDGCKKCVCKINSWKAVVITLLVFSIAVLVSIVVSRLAREPPDDTPTPGPEYQLNQGAVATDVPVCSELSASILRKNGSAVDAAITALLCVGVVHLESSGLGGGGFMVVRHDNGSVYSINFREKAPKGATVDMFHSNSTLSETGGLAVAVPGELKGMELAHRLFGKLPWSDLFQPVIDLCRNGFNMTSHTEDALNSTWDKLSTIPIFRQVYLRDDGSLKKSGDLVTRPDLASTMELIANESADVFYRGVVAQSIVSAVNNSEEGGILTMEDMENYQALLVEPLQVDYNGHTIYAPPSPAGGPLLLFSLNVMDNYNLRVSSREDELSQLNLTYHRLVETLKYGFALRTSLGDPNCDSCDDIAQDILAVQKNMTSNSYAAKVKSSISDDHTYNVSHYHAHYSQVQDSGTTHISVLSSDGQAVSVTSTVNTYFGSKVMTDTGILLNNEMDDFSSPNITNAYGVRPSVANYIHPGKRPLSSTCPTIIVKQLSDSSKQTRPFLIIGGSGGTRIPTAVFQAALRYLSLSETVSEAIEARRVHHQLLPDVVCPEVGFPESILEFLESRGHVINRDCHGYAVVQGVAVSNGGNVTAHSDGRKQGHAVVVDRT